MKLDQQLSQNKSKRVEENIKSISAQSFLWLNDKRNCDLLFVTLSENLLRAIYIYLNKFSIEGEYLCAKIYGFRQFSGYSEYFSLNTFAFTIIINEVNLLLMQ